MHESRLIVDRLAVVKIEATLWSGRKQLRPEDLILGDGSRLPPPDLASLGSKRICDPRDVQVFSRLKKESERQCQRVGSRFLGGYAVPEESLSDLAQKLDTVRSQFEAARFDFLSRYDQAIEGWAGQHPDFGDAIRRAVDPVNRVARQLAFDYVIFRIRPPEATERSLERRLQDLPMTLLDEVAHEARLYRTESLEGKTEVTRRALGPLRRIRDKLDGLAFLDPFIRDQVDAIDEVMDRLPRRGDIRGSLLRDIEARVLRLETIGGTPSSLDDSETQDVPSGPDDIWCSDAPGIARISPPPDVIAPGQSFWF